MSDLFGSDSLFFEFDKKPSLPVNSETSESESGEADKVGFKLTFLLKLQKFLEETSKRCRSDIFRFW